MKGRPDVFVVLHAIRNADSDNAALAVLLDYLIDNHNTKYGMLRRAVMAEKGECIRCSTKKKPVEALPGKKYCGYCQELDQERYEARKAKRGKNATV